MAKGKQEQVDIAERARSIARLMERLNAIDDPMFRLVAEDAEVVQEILRVVLQDDGLVVEQAIPQRELNNLGARSVTVDVLCQMGDGSIVAVEVQKKREEDPPRRVRYERSCADTWITQKGTEFVEIPKIAAVYISRTDPFGDGLPLYHADRVVRETGRRIEDGTLDVYANVASAQGDSDLERMLRYLARSEGDLEGFPALSARVQYFKGTEKGRAKMGELVEDFAREYAEDYARELAEDYARELAEDYARDMAEKAAETAKAEGIAQGMAEGMARGMEEGKAEGKAEGELVGRAKGVLQSLGNLMANLGWSADAAMDALGVPENERSGYLAKLS